VSNAKFALCRIQSRLHMPANPMMIYCSIRAENCVSFACMVEASMNVNVYAAEDSEQAKNKNQITQITLLMPVWGYRFTGRFLEFCLPTLLAPNNIPALANELPCRFILLSSAGDVPFIRAHPAWRKLEELCATDIEFIDDLITHANHTATITLAFERAIRRAGAAICNTCFFFLMSDYLVADGSLRTVLTTMRAGARVVLTGNFQVVAEDFSPLLRSTVDPESEEIALSPRELVRRSLAHLHPATVANIVNFGLMHNAHANRLFWRVDETALIGRFYLMHAMAIHPEVPNFVIGSSWDYSFVPELCPSGNIAILTDSDQYFVVELQRRDYESENLRPGPITAKEIAASLSSWATAGHRANVDQTLLFHAGDPPQNLSEVAAQADGFVQSVRDNLSTPPISHHGHPYWLGSVAMNRWRSNRPLNREDWNFILNQAPPRGRIGSMLQRLRGRLFGFPPAVTRLHPWWPEYRLPLETLNKILAANERVLLITYDAAAFAQWMARTAGDVLTIGSDQLLTLPQAAYAPLMNSFDACFFVLSKAMLAFCDVLIARTAPLLKQGGKIHVLVYNDGPRASAEKFATAFAANAARFSGSAAWIEDVRYVESSRFRWSVRTALTRLLTGTASGSISSFTAFILTAAPILLATYLTGRAAKLDRNPPGSGICSSIFITLRVSDQAKTASTMWFESESVADLASLGLTAGPQEGPPIPAGRYGIEGRYVTPFLGDGDAPTKFAFIHAAYEFAANLLVAHGEVAEFGLADAVGVPVILQRIKTLSVYDPREHLVAKLQRQFADNQALATRVHDVLAGPSPRKFGSIYSIDFIQYLSRDEEEAFVANLRASLRHGFGFALIGCPSFGGNAPTGRAEDARPHTSPPRMLRPDTASSSNGARIYRRSGEELVALMKQYFHNVLAFSMIEQSIQPGIHRSAQHVFALGCGKKWRSTSLRSVAARNSERHPERA